MEVLQGKLVQLFSHFLVGAKGAEMLVVIKVNGSIVSMHSF
jgi:hypothetical protein